jgi:hypothetical protein
MADVAAINEGDRITGMRITVFGTGWVGQALAGGLLNRGHIVTVGTRRPDDPAVVARLAELPGVSVMPCASRRPLGCRVPPDPPGLKVPFPRPAVPQDLSWRSA